jgi:hypothetical protein
MTEEILDELNAEGLRSVFLKYTRTGFECTTYILQKIECKGR